ncbi:hypothetical protein [Maribellus sp. YY47]|uniref:hypothetical protein n=1 Tax=Maribellus sp. YY47 TaxID=2929486 RepID=UPI002000B25B|nr:hypothetical protein [Maribellus sp. YY47]MCK3682668.1 hypothetical protein [Maribellus sp. YY47]
MIKNLSFFLVLFLLLSVMSYGQKINGYILNNKGEKNECFLRNIGSGESTGKYEYSLPGENIFHLMDLAKIKEFAIYNQVKCVRELIQIDVSPNRIRNAKEIEKGPELDEGHAYLRVLFEGKLGSLYAYYDQGNTFYYYRVRQSTIELLYHKQYQMEIATGVVETSRDDTYKEQLAQAFHIQEERTLQKLSYTKNSLVQFFENYHKAHNASGENIAKNDSKPIFTVRGVLNSNSFSSRMQDLGDTEFVSFKAAQSFGYGLEVEYNFAFNRNKLAVFGGANYASYYSDYSDHSIQVTHDGYKWDYYSMDLPVGLRYYGHLFPGGRLFLEVGFCPQIILDNSELFLNSNHTYRFDSSAKEMFGAGFSYGRFALAGRVFTTNNVTQNLYKRGSKLKQWTISVQYDIFRSIR